MSRKKWIGLILVCAGLDVLCLCAAGLHVDLKGFALLVLADYFVYRVFHLFHVREESHRALDAHRRGSGPPQ